MPESGSTSGGVSTLMLTPGGVRRRRRAGSPSGPWPQPCGSETTPGRMRSVTSTVDLELADRRGDAGPGDRRADRARRRRPDGSAACSGWCRRPAQARCASSCCWSAGGVGRSGRRPSVGSVQRGAQPGAGRPSAARGEFDLAARRCAALPAAGAAAGRGRCRAGARLSRSRVRPSGSGAERVAVRARAEASCRAARSLAGAGRRASVNIVDRAAAPRVSRGRPSPWPASSR